MSLSLYSEYRQQQLEALLEITRIFASSPDLSTLLRTILSYAAELVHADFGYIALTTRSGALRITTGYRLPTAVFERLSPYLAQKRPVAEFWSEEELRYQLVLVNEVLKTPLEQIIALPLVLENEDVVGGIFLFRSGTMAFTPACCCGISRTRPRWQCAMPVRWSSFAQRRPGSKLSSKTILTAL